MRAGLALVAGLNVIAIYGFTYELFSKRRVAIMASAFLALSPIFLVHSALVLTYPLSLLGLDAAGWALLRATRTRHSRDFVVGGLLLGISLLTRPFDVLLFGVPLLALTSYRMARTQPWWQAATRSAVPVAVGLLPAVVATAWYNWQATGSATAFPNMTADPLNTFGFGTRRLMEGQPTLSYTVGDATRALGTNAAAVPSWIFGGIFMLALAAVGIIVARRRAETWALVVIGLAFPIGYFFWWATTLSGATAKNGLGPQYYLPSFVPLLILGAVGFDRILQRRNLIITGLAVVVLVGATWWSVPDKVRANHGFSQGFERVDRSLPAGLDNALVFVPFSGGPYILAPYPFLQTDPSLDGSVVYAADRGAADAQLIRQMPSRNAYLLRQQYEPGDQLFKPSGILTPLHVVTGSQLTVSVDPLDVPRGRFERAYLSDGTTTSYVPLTPGSVGSAASSEWTVDVGAPTGGASTTLTVPDGSHGQLSVGVETSSSANFSKPSKTESRMPYATSSAGITALAPGAGWSLQQFPNGAFWLPYDVKSHIRVGAAAP